MKLEKTHMKTLADLREQIQEDIITYLDGMDDEIIDDLCQVVVERFNEYTNELR